MSKRLITVREQCYPAKVLQDERSYEWRATYQADRFPFTRFDSVGDTPEEACDHLSTFMRDFA